MFLLRCDQCGKEVAWYLTDHLPNDWADCGGRELCLKCLREYRTFEQKLDKQRALEIDKYFGKGA